MNWRVLWFWWPMVVLVVIVPLFLALGWIHWESVAWSALSFGLSLVGIALVPWWTRWRRRWRR